MNTFFDDQEITPGFCGHVFYSKTEHLTLFTEEFKEWLFNFQDKKCGYCGDFLGETWRKNRNSHVEHVSAKCSGGADTPPNLLYSCKSCNSTKGQRGIDYLRTATALKRLGISKLLKVSSAEELVNMGLLNADINIKFLYETEEWPHVNPKSIYSKIYDAEAEKLESQAMVLRKALGELEK